MCTELINILVASVITKSRLFHVLLSINFALAQMLLDDMVRSQPSNVSKFTTNVHNELRTIPIAPHSIARFMLSKNSVD